MSSLPTGRRWQQGAKFCQKRWLLQCFAPFKSAGFEHPGPFCKKRPQLLKSCFWTLLRMQNAAKADVFGQIRLHVAIGGLWATSSCYLVPFLGKTLKKPTFKGLFPLVKSAKAAPGPPETSGFIVFFGGLFVGWAKWHFSVFFCGLL